MNDKVYQKQGGSFTAGLSRLGFFLNNAINSPVPKKHASLLPTDQKRILYEFEDTSYGKQAREQSGFQSEWLDAVAQTTAKLGCTVAIRDGDDIPQKRSAYLKANAIPKSMDFKQKSSKYAPVKGFLPVDKHYGRRGAENELIEIEDMGLKGYQAVARPITLSEIHYVQQKYSTPAVRQTIIPLSLFGLPTKAQATVQTTVILNKNGIEVKLSDEKINKDLSEQVTFRAKFPGDFNEKDKLKIERYLYGNLTQQDLPAKLSAVIELPAVLEAQFGANAPFQTIEVWGYKGRPICSDADIFTMSIPYETPWFTKEQPEFYQIYNAGDLDENMQLHDILITLVDKFRQTNQQDLKEIIDRLYIGLPSKKALNINSDSADIAMQMIVQLGIAENPGFTNAFKILFSHMAMAKYQLILSKEINDPWQAYLASSMIQHGADADYDVILQPKPGEIAKAGVIPDEAIYVFPNDFAYTHGTNKPPSLEQTDSILNEIAEERLEKLITTRGIKQEQITTKLWNSIQTQISAQEVDVRHQQNVIQRQHIKLITSHAALQEQFVKTSVRWAQPGNTHMGELWEHVHKAETNVIEAAQHVQLINSFR